MGRFLSPEPTTPATLSVDDPTLGSVSGLDPTDPTPESLGDDETVFGSFVGREDELEEIARALRGAVAGRGVVLLIEGEPGSGKTRTAWEALHGNRETRVDVLSTQCDQAGGAPAFAPWTQLLNDIAEATPPGELEALLGEDAWILAARVPTIRSKLPSVRIQVSLSPESEGYRFREAVLGLLRRASQRRPLVLFLDDIHCADESSLALLSFLARRLHDTRVALVAAYREEELRDRSSIEEIVEDLLCGPAVLRRSLAPFDRTAVQAMIASRSGMKPSPDLVAAVHRATGGNPLFLTEVMRLLVSEGRLRRAAFGLEAAWVVPSSIRAVLRRRLRRLSPSDQSLLAAAAVLGHRFEGQMLEAVVPGDAHAVRDALRRITEERILRPVDGWAPAYEFMHGLIRETIYDDLTETQRRELHRSVLVALRSVAGPHGDGADEAIAHHWLASADPGEEMAIVGCLLGLAERAQSKLAYERAAEISTRAVGILHVFAPQSVDRCQALLFQAKARVLAGDPRGAEESFRCLADLSADVGAPEFLAEAALGIAGPHPIYGRYAPDRLQLLESALQGLPDTATALRGRLLGRLACELQHEEPVARRVALSDAALEIGRALGDLKTLAGVAMEVNTRSGRASERRRRLEILDELDEEARRQGSIEGQLDAAGWRVITLLEHGEIPSFDVELERFARLASATRHPLYLHRVLSHRATRATIGGDLDEASRLAFESVNMARTVSDWNTDVVLSGQMLSVGRLRGNLVDIVPIALDALDRYASFPAVRAGIARAFVAADRLDEARREFETLAIDEFGRIPDDIFLLVTLGYLTEVCDALGDAPRAQQLYRLLEPCAGRMMLAGLGGFFGSVRHSLGAAAHTYGDLDRAIEHFEDALKEYATMGARPFTALTQLALSRSLLDRGGDGDARRAAELLREAVVVAKQLEMTALPIEAQSLLARTVEDGEKAGARDSRPSWSDRKPRRLFRREGEDWSIGSTREPLRIADSVGLRCLAELLRRPHQDLLASEVAHAAGAAGGAFAHPTGQTGVDDQARRQYRKRVRELQGELEIAREEHDLGRTEAIQYELERLQDELGRGIGLLGRSRRDSVHERARQNVTRAIRRAIRAIGRKDTALGHHLDVSVRTGTLCRYDPEPNAEPDWQL